MSSEAKNEVVLEAEAVIAGYVPEADILNGVSIVVREARSSPSSAPTAPASRP